MSSAALAAVAACAAVAAAPTAASAAIQLTAVSETPTIQFPDPGSVTFAVTLTVSGQDERFVLTYRPPAFGGPSTDPSVFTGGALQSPGVPSSVDGPARVTSAGMPVSDLACAVAGTTPDGATLEISAPANSTTTFRFTFRVAEDAPWPSTRYDVSFLARRTLRGAVLAAAPAVGPRPAGARGVRLTMRTDPQGTWAHPRKARPVRRGQRIAISGTTTPARPGADVAIVGRYGEDDRRTLATARTDGRGRYRTSLPMRGASWLSFEARLTAPGRQPLAHTCPVWFVRG